jgi:hypothetical protein
MDYSVYITLHFETEKEQTRDKLKNNFIKTISNELELKETDKNIIIFEIKNMSTWELCMYKIIKLSQNIGRQWIITGSIEFGISLWSNNPIITGIKAIEINCDNKQNTR